MRRRLGAALLCAALAVTGHGSAQSPAAAPPLATALPALIERSLPSGATLAVVVTEAGSGRVLFAREADAPLNPASDTKLLTAATALAVLGADHRFTTTLHGTVVGEAVTGALVFRGQGDPSLTSADLYALARELASAGVRRVAGDLVIDDTARGAQHLPPAFEQQPAERAPFRAAVSAATVDENAITVRVFPGAPGSAAVVSVEPRGYVEVEGAISTTAGGAPSVTLDLSSLPDGRERVRVGGSVPAGSPSAAYRRRLERPSLATGHALRAALLDAGVRVDGAVRVGDAGALGPVVATHASQPLSALLYEVGKDSNNLYAELTLLAVAAASPGAVSFQRGTERVVEWCREAGVDTRGLVLRNGSGLYDANRVSARQLSQVLRAAWRRPALREEYVAQLAVGGDDGTLRNRLRIPGAERVVRAKTGTLDDAIALSGYVLAVDPSRTLVFSILANGVRGHGGEARQLADAIVTELVRWTRRRP